MFKFIESKIYLYLVIGIILSGCAKQYQPVGSHHPRDIGAIKKSFYIEKISLQSFNVKFYDKSMISAKEAETKWLNKAHELCKGSKPKTTISRSEQISYIKDGRSVAGSREWNSKGSLRESAEFACHLYGPIGCVVGEVMAATLEKTNDNIPQKDPNIEKYQKEYHDNLYTYHLVEGQVFCP